MNDIGLPCVHCGLCLDTCPTYRESGNEADSPRGRIYIMEAVNNAQLDLDEDAKAHLEGCLGCLACETACPSGVDFGRRIEKFLPQIREPSGFLNKYWHRFSDQIYSNYSRLGAALKLARVMDIVGLGRLRRRIPGLELLPAGEVNLDQGTLSPVKRSRIHQPTDPKLRVAIVGRCGADVMVPSINRAAVEVLQRNNVEVVELFPSSLDACCGALAHHSGDQEGCSSIVKRNVKEMSEALGSGRVDILVTTAAGCGAMVRDYGHLAAELDPQTAAAAKTVSDNVRDICEVLVDMDFDRPQIAQPQRRRVAYHDACHLVNAAGVTEAPRIVCQAATGAEPIDLGENNLCCGSAGRYNLDHPVLSRRMGERKAELATKVGVDTIAVANVGCQLQLSRALAVNGSHTRVAHPVELLAEAYLAADASALD